MPSPALEGIRVVELAAQLSGPFGAMVLADLGAEVIKVESRQRPDAARTVPSAMVGDQATYYLSLNRNKRSVLLDLKDERHRAAFLELVAASDVVFDNFRPGVMQRLGLDHARLSAVNPGIITCSLSGFGQTGPKRDRPGYDYLMQALAGTMSLTGEPDGPPTKYGISVVDHVAGLYAAIGILAALAARDRHPERRGQSVDVALLDTHLSLLSYVAAEVLNGGRLPERQPMSAHPSLVPAQAFQTLDGHVVVMPLANHFFPPLCDALELSELADDPRFVDGAQRLRHREELLAVLKAQFLGRSTADWVRSLEEHGVPAAPVQTVTEALEMDQVGARDMLLELAHPGYGSYRTVGNPLKLSDAVQPARAAPMAGEDTAAVLTEMTGLSPEEVARIVGAP